MPLHIDEIHDAITSLTSFSTSPVLEMLVSLTAFAHPWRVRTWTEEVAGRMGEKFQTDLLELYNAHNYGGDFIEFAIDFPDQNDVPGFIKYIREMPVKNFIFYLTGRLLPLEIIPENGDLQEVQRLMISFFKNNPQENPCSLVEPGRILEIPMLKKHVTELWEDYWKKYLETEIEGLRPLWETSIKEKEIYLIRNGGTALLEQVTSHTKLPPPLPKDMPYSIVRYIPICRIHRDFQVYYGYGNVTVFYDANITRQKTKEVLQRKRYILTKLKALGDDNRLRILRLVADSYQKLNGKMIAEKLGISQSVVSRHLGQLKEADLIKEFSPDNRNITYSLEWDIIGSLSLEVQNYLGAGSES